MKKTLTALLAIFLTLTLSANSGKIILTGTVKNPTDSSIMITHLNNQKLVSAELDANGKFKMSVKIQDGYYFLTYGRNTAYIYLYPKDNITLVFDANEFESTLIFDGKGAARNNYLLNKEKVGSKLTENLEAFYTKDEAKYLENINAVKRAHITSLSRYEVESFFKSEEIKSLEFERLLSIQNYKSNYKFYLGDDITPSENFYAPIKNVKLDYESNYRKQPYFRYLVSSIWNKRIEAANDAEGMFQVLRSVPLKALIIDLINGLYSKMSSNRDRAKDYLELVKLVTNNKQFIGIMEKRYNEVLKLESKDLAEGAISPVFSYESIDGKIVNLSDLKGKYVYIDVWATWCAPCIKQVPYLQKLEERYHNKNIVFVSISVDRESAKATWKKMVKDKQLGGVQLFADKSFDSDFMNAYSINSIPRFILIDTEGKIINSKAPRPSFEKTKALLDGLLK